MERRRSRSAADIISSYFVCDIQTVTHHRYQPGHTGGIPVYSLEYIDKATGKVYPYLCAPPVGVKPPARFSVSGTPWEVIGIEDGRTIYGMPSQEAE